MDSSTTVAIIVLLFGLASFLSGILVIIRYVQVRTLRKQPGMLIFWQCLCQAVLDLLWALSTFIWMVDGCDVDRKKERKLLCLANGLCAVYMYFVGLNYIASLSLEILFTIRHPLLNSYSFRSLFYHALSHIFGVILVIFLGLYDAVGLSALNTCFIRGGSWGAYIMLLPVCIYYPFAIFVAVHAIVSFWYTRDIKKKVYLLRYTLVMSVYALGWLPVGVSYISKEFFEHNWQLSEVCLVLSSTAGLIANTIRFSDPALMGLTKKHLRKRMSADRQPASLRESIATSSVHGDVVGFFYGVKIEGALSALVSLHYLFTHLPESAPGRYFRLKFKGIQLEATDFDSESLRQHCNLHLVTSYGFYVKEHAPSEFARIRSAAAANIVAALDPAANNKVLGRNIGNRGGKSDAFIYVTHDRKLVLKTISRKERQLFINTLLPLYAARVLSGKSLLARSLGVYTIRNSKGLKQHILLMENIITATGISAIFDMKGSKLARKILKHSQEIPVEELPSYQTYKDLDFFQTQKVLRLAQSDERRLRNALFQDVELLRQTKIMDYSLLLAVCSSSSDSSQYMFRGTGVDQGKVYYVGIIDYLELYSARKQLEGAGKSIMHSRIQRDEISSVDPETYATRFLKLIEKILPSG